MYENFISQLTMYANVIRVLSKGYLPISLLPPPNLQEILNEVKRLLKLQTQTTIQISRGYICIMT